MFTTFGCRIQLSSSLGVFCDPTQEDPATAKAGLTSMGPVVDLAISQRKGFPPPPSLPENPAGSQSLRPSQDRDITWLSMNLGVACMDSCEQVFSATPKLPGPYNFDDSIISVIKLQYHMDYIIQNPYDIKHEVIVIGLRCAFRGCRHASATMELGPVLSSYTGGTTKRPMRCLKQANDGEHEREDYSSFKISSFIPHQLFRGLGGGPRRVGAQK